MEFEWDEDKNLSNFRKHGIWFEEAQTIWAGESSSEFFDPERSSLEAPFIRVGYSSVHRLLLVVFCERSDGDVLRLIQRGGLRRARGGNMKKEYDLKKLKKRPGKVKIEKDAAKVPVSIRLDGSVLAAIKTEAERLGVPYQTLIGSILHRYASDELIDRRSLDLVKSIHA